MQKKSKKDFKGVYGLEITTTNACNYNCTYCFERNHELEKTLLDSKIVIKRVNELLNSQWFNEQYCGVKIILWGGEPTVNMPLCTDLMEAFMDNERVCFFIYTNGSTVDELLPILMRLKKQPFIKEKQPKITVQISYDGNPSHDLNRKHKSNTKPTSLQCLKAIDRLETQGIDYGLKATMAWKDYHMLPECWDDFAVLHFEFGSHIKYALTVDYYDVQYSKYKDQVRKALIEVSRKEIKFFKKYGYFLSNIFRNNKAICATGKSMACVNTDGNVYPCHGSIYSKCSNYLKYGNIFDDFFINSLKGANELYANNDIEPDECKECVALSCLRCNVKKFEESKKSHLDRWYDYPAQKDLCKYYKLVGVIGTAMWEIIGERNNAMHM